MSQSLRTRLLLSYLLLVGLLLGVCLIAVAGFFRLGRSVDRILRDNYQSVIAAQNMKESLERIDSASTFYLAGQEKKAQQQFLDNVPRFEGAYRVEANNITETGEQALSDGLGSGFTTYSRETRKMLFARPPLSDAAANHRYVGTLAPQFLQLKNTAQQVLDLNQEAIVRADARARNEARRATLISVGMTTVAVLLGAGLAWRGINRLMTPLVSLTRQAEEIGAGHLNQRIEVGANDEIGVLARTFNTMAERLRDARQIEENRLHRAERMSDAALADLYDPVIVTDADARIVHLNRAAEGLFGQDETVRGKAARAIIGDARLADAIESAVRQAETSAEEGDAALITLGASRDTLGRVYRLRANPMRDEAGTHLGAVAVLEDVTYQQEVDRLKTEFIGVASHELRTPVTSLLLGVQLLEEGAVGALTSPQHEIVQSLHQDLQRLERMMRELLDLTRLEAGANPPRFEAVPPSELISAARQAVQAQADLQGVRLEVEIAPDTLPVRADRGQIGRALVNLLSNAIRHTPKGGRVHLEASIAPEGQVRFAIRDTGVGIPAAYLAHIWERFVQVPGATRGGAGLGLSIVQSIVRAHGGVVGADSVLGQGSTFSFTLPLASEAENNGHGTHSGN